MSIKSRTGLFSLRTIRGPEQCAAAGEDPYNNCGTNTCPGWDNTVDPPCACNVGCGGSCGCACACI